MMNETHKQNAHNSTAQDSVSPPQVQAKRPYTPPELKEHGSAKDVTLQTFFGSFSPTPQP
jgi:hypothetical protein